MVMNCPDVSSGLYKLRKENKKLLKQLELNSVILKNTLKVLSEAVCLCKRNDLTPFCKDKFESWKTRNDSCQVAAALNSSTMYNSSGKSSSSNIHSNTFHRKRSKSVNKNNEGNARKLKRVVTSKDITNERAETDRSLNNQENYVAACKECYCCSSQDSEGNLKLNTNRSKTYSKRFENNQPGFQKQKHPAVKNETKKKHSCLILDERDSKLKQIQSTCSKISPTKSPKRTIISNTSLISNEHNSQYDKYEMIFGKQCDNMCEEMTCAAHQKLHSSAKDNLRKSKRCCYCNRIQKLNTKENIESSQHGDIQNGDLQFTCSCDYLEQQSVFDEINEFRRKNWFDCHSHRSSLCLSSFVGSKLASQSSSGCSSGHKCIHPYILNDRQFAVPLNSDERRNSVCFICHHPQETSKDVPTKLKLSDLQNPSTPITLPKYPMHLLQKENSVNDSDKSFEGQKRMFLVQEVSEKLNKNVKMNKFDIPSDSLALRFQKGIV